MIDSISRAETCFLLQVNTLEVKLKEKCTVDYQVKIFPGQTHGFVHRKREDMNPVDKPCIQEARTDMLNWFNKYIWMEDGSTQCASSFHTPDLKKSF